MTPNNPTSAFVVVPRSEQQAPQVYCDGVMGITFSPANCKLDLFQTLGVGEGGEQRVLTQTLVIPTVALLELCRNILGGFEQQATVITDALRENEGKILGVQPQNKKGV